MIDLRLGAEELAELTPVVPLPVAERLRSASGKIEKAREGAERVRQAAGRFNAYARVESGPPRPIDISSVVAAVRAWCETRSAIAPGSLRSTRIRLWSWGTRRGSGRSC